MHKSEIHAELAPLLEWNLRVFAICQRRFLEGEWCYPDVCSPFWRFYVNQSDGFSLEWQEKGETRRLDLRGGNAYFIPAGVSFSGSNPGATRHFYIHFDVLGPPPSVISPALRPFLSRPLELRADEMSSALRAGIAALFSLCKSSHEDASPDVHSTLQAKAVLFAALAHCAQDWDSSAPQESQSDIAAVQPALRYIELHLGEPMSLEELARKCHFSVDHFSVRFRQATGQPPARYIRERRLTFAAQQLLFSNQSIEQIAHSCGFCDRFHFSRAFAKNIGLSPAAYRKTGPV